MQETDGALEGAPSITSWAPSTIARATVVGAGDVAGLCCPLAQGWSLAEAMRLLERLEAPRRPRLPDVGFPVASPAKEPRKAPNPRVGATRPT